MGEGVVFEQIDFLSVQLFLKLCIEHFQVLFYDGILFLQVFPYSFYLGLVLPQNPEYLFRLYAGPLYAERVFYRVFLQKVKDFSSLQIELFVYQKIEFVPVLHQVL